MIFPATTLLFVESWRSAEAMTNALISSCDVDGFRVDTPMCLAKIWAENWASDRRKSRPIFWLNLVDITINTRYQQTIHITTMNKSSIHYI